MSGHLDSEWRSYLEKVVPKNAGPEQLQGTEMAFYAGATALLGLLARGITKGGEATEEDYAFMDAVAKELRDHAVGLIKRAVAP